MIDIGRWNDLVCIYDTWWYAYMISSGLRIHTTAHHCTYSCMVRRHFAFNRAIAKPSCMHPISSWEQKDCTFHFLLDQVACVVYYRYHASVSQYRMALLGCIGNTISDITVLVRLSCSIWYDESPSMHVVPNKTMRYSKVKRGERGALGKKKTHGPLTT